MVSWGEIMRAFLWTFLKSIGYGAGGVTALGILLVVLVYGCVQLRSVIDRNFDCPSEQFLTGRLDAIIEDAKTHAPIAGARVTLAAPPPTKATHAVSGLGGYVELPRLKSKPTACPDPDPGLVPVMLHIEAKGYEPQDIWIPEAWENSEGSRFYSEHRIAPPAVVELVPRQ